MRIRTPLAASFFVAICAALPAQADEPAGADVLMTFATKANAEKAVVPAKT